LSGSAFDVLHHEVIRSDIANLADVGTIQCRNGLRLALKTFAELSSGDFDREVALQTPVSGSVHFSHATGTDGRKNFVGTESVPFGKRHVLDPR
jgi:hypothetical protein